MGCFLSIQQESSLSRLCLGHSTETPRPCLRLFQKVKPIRLNRTKIFFSLPVSVSLRFNSTDWKGAPREKRGEESERGQRMGSRVEALIESWEAAREKGESGQRDIKRRSTSDGGYQERSCFLPAWLKQATDKASTLLIFPLLPSRRFKFKAKVSVPGCRSGDFTPCSRPRLCQSHNFLTSVHLFCTLSPIIVARFLRFQLSWLICTSDSSNVVTGLARQLFPFSFFVVARPVHLTCKAIYCWDT